MRNIFFVLMGVLLVSGLSGCATTNQSQASSKEQELHAKVASLEEELRAKDSEIQSLQESASTVQDSVPDHSLSSVKPTPKRIQAALKNAGYYSGTVDGKVGKNTRKAIIAFQKANGLKGDGVVGNRTWQLLKKHI